MKIQIKNKFTDKIIIEGEAETIKEFLVANRGANLRGADLWGAKIKITQQSDLTESLGIIIKD